MKRTLASAFATAALAVGGLTVVAAPPASAATCTTWQDENTFGVSCNSANPYYAKVRCSNGQDARGVTTNSGRWSYAYCTAFGTNVRIAGGAQGGVIWA
ncbi:hypothetical protein [Peterkaempfera bronchialis]|uniref:Secreted protein n=1 Tax=Peterkaempfera bronchialis TaxID=2126346 RepID=A0A345T2Z2_9ACTN|nr:hypothetical protein [Peterkaempfera bronchialis]AXI80347.1 hypothetical protein C7M71_026060 [Peterkaempfera bronchialis]